jgi:ATP-dependent exoDNAse (exonuclease V) beta subunit
VAFVRDDGGLVEGIVDLAFLENGVWTVVDFKTDLRIGGRIEEYQRQVGLYVRAIEKATGQKCRGILLRL